MQPDLKVIVPVAAMTLAGLVALQASAQAWLVSHPPESAGRPMDELGAQYGDLAAFDAITEIGADQSVDVPYCDRRPELLMTLAEDFAEVPVAQAPLEGQRRVELWASEVMGTWTAVYTRADGVSCVVSSGVNWTRAGDPVALLASEGLLG